MARTRRNFSAEFKTQVVLDIIDGSKSTADVCREYNLKPDLVSHWKNQFLANAAQVFESGKVTETLYKVMNFKNYQQTVFTRIKELGGNVNELLGEESKKTI